MGKEAKAELMPRVRVAGLKTTDGILTELRSVYRAARRGEIPASEATKLTYILKVMSEVMTLRELETRLDCLENGRPYLSRDEREHSQDPAEAH